MQGGPMEIRVLKYFLMIAREESITGAAERLHITQPTLSRQIAQLEEEVGVKLLDRSARRVALTPAGLLLRRRAEEMVSLLDKTERELSESEGKLEGVLNVAGGDLGATADFVRLLKEFREIHPLVDIDYFSGISTDITERMDQGLTDVGLLVNSYNFEKYEYLPIGKPRRNGIFLSASDPLAKKEYITPKDLEGKTIFLTGRKRLNSEFCTWAGESYKKYDLGINVSLPNNKVVMLREGMGCFMASEGVLSSLDEKQICWRPMRPETEIHTFLAWRRSQPFSRVATEFIRFIKEKLK